MIEPLNRVKSTCPACAARAVLKLQNKYADYSAGDMLEYTGVCENVRCCARLLMKVKRP